MHKVNLTNDQGFAGPYRIIGALGEGGMGIVRLAVAPDGRAVAVKMLRPAFAADREARRRLAREVESLRRVRHPQVAEVLDADLDAELPYLVTAFVPGVTLETQVQNQGSLAPDAVLRIGRQMLQALDAIHASGVIHRDVKPSNVMVLDGDPILIDFGIAQVNDDSRITSAGLVMGTPGYLPPEVVAGRPLTSATDWWGWGATLAFAATGRHPFGEGPAAVVLDRVRLGTPDLAGIAPGLAAVLARAMDVDPARRLNAAGLLRELDRVAVGPSTSLPPTSADIPSFAAAARTAASTEVITGSAAELTEVLPQNPARTLPMSGADRTVALTPPALPQPPQASSPTASRSATARLPATSDQVPADAATDETPALGASAPRAPMRRTLALMLAAVTTLSMVVPGVVIVIGLVWLIIARAVDRTTAATVYRRHIHGRRSSDRFVAGALLPWRLLVAVPRALVALVLPVLLGVSASFLVGLLVSASAPKPATSVSLAVGGLVGYVTAWVGPGGAAVRRPTTAAARALGRHHRLRWVIWIFLAMLTVAAVMTAMQGVPADWRPLSLLPTWQSVVGRSGLV